MVFLARDLPPAHHRAALQAVQRLGREDEPAGAVRRFTVLDVLPRANAAAGPFDHEGRLARTFDTGTRRLATGLEKVGS